MFFWASGRLIFGRKGGSCSLSFCFGSWVSDSLLTQVGSGRKVFFYFTRVEPGAGPQETEPSEKGFFRCAPRPFTPHLISSALEESAACGVGVVGSWTFRKVVWPGMEQLKKHRRQSRTTAWKLLFFVRQTPESHLPWMDFPLDASTAKPVRLPVLGSGNRSLASKDACNSSSGRCCPLPWEHCSGRFNLEGYFSPVDGAWSSISAGVFELVQKKKEKEQTSAKKRRGEREKSQQAGRRTVLVLAGSTHLQTIYIYIYIYISIYLSTYCERVWAPIAFLRLQGQI